MSIVLHVVRYEIEIFASRIRTQGKPTNCGTVRGKNQHC